MRAKPSACWSRLSPPTPPTPHHKPRANPPLRPTVERSAPALYRALGAALREASPTVPARPCTPPSRLRRKATPSRIALVELGLTDLDQSDQASALTNSRRAVAAAPDLPISQLHLGETLLSVGELPEAAQVLQRALALNPKAAALAPPAGAGLPGAISAGNPLPSAAALGHLQRATELEPDNAAYAADLGPPPWCAMAAWPPRSATSSAPRPPPTQTPACGPSAARPISCSRTTARPKCFGHALDLAPDSAAALLGSARVTFAQGRLSDAARQAEAAVRAAPDDADTLICLADIAASRGDAAAAERHYAAAATKAHSARPRPAGAGPPVCPTAEVGQGSVRARARRHRRHDLRRNLRRAGRSSLQLGQPYPGHQSLPRGHPHRAAPRRPPAHARPRLPRPGPARPALSHLMQARDLAPADDGILREIGLVFDQRKQFDRALEMYKHAIEVGPKSANNYIRAGVALETKRVPEALVALERAVASTLRPRGHEQLAVVSAMHLVTPIAKAAAPA